MWVVYHCCRQVMLGHVFKSVLCVQTPTTRRHASKQDRHAIPDPPNKRAPNHCPREYCRWYDPTSRNCALVVVVVVVAIVLDLPQLCLVLGDCRGNLRHAGGPSFGVLLKQVGLSSPPHLDWFGTRLLGRHLDGRFAQNHGIPTHLGTRPTLPNGRQGRLEFLCAAVSAFALWTPGIIKMGETNDTKA